MENISVNFYAFSYPESNRPVNEDYYIANDKKCLYAVSDGLGSTSGADKASRIVIETVLLAFSKEESLVQEIPAVMRGLSKTILAELNKDKSSLKMSATLTLLYLTNEKYYIAQIGDSRCYLLRNGSLEQITNDHSLAFEQYLNGAISKKELASHPNQKLLTRCLRKGSKLAVIDIFEGDVKVGDTFLLCSDGLIKDYSDDELIEFLQKKDGHLAIEQEVQSKTRTDDTTCVFVFL